MIADKIFLLVIGSFTCMHSVNSILKVSHSLFQGTPNILSLVLEAGKSLPSLSLTISLLIDSRDVTLLCHLWRANPPCFMILSISELNVSKSLMQSPPPWLGPAPNIALVKRYSLMNLESRFSYQNIRSASLSFLFIWICKKPFLMSPVIQ